jgi:hypothetical protein
VDIPRCLEDKKSSCLFVSALDDEGSPRYPQQLANRSSLIIVSSVKLMLVISKK